MNRQPRGKDEGVINKRMVFSILSIGIIMGVIILLLFNHFHPQLRQAQTVAFTSLVIFELVRIQAIRSRYSIPTFSNRYLWLAIIGSILLQLAVVYTPLNQLFEVVPLAIGPWIAILSGLLAFACLTFLLIKVEDYVFSPARTNC